MSTNLYPRTTDPSILEQLARVPAGTAIAYAAWIQAYPESPARFESQAAYEADIAAWDAWCAQGTESMHRYKHLCDYGFGRISAAAWHIATRIAARDNSHPATGDATESADVTALLAAQGVQLPDGVPPTALGGLFWS